ncbi:MAG: prepilin-type N-terminal cleavage/methylation domain-containing protein [Pseudomonadota bacterium]
MKRQAGFTLVEIAIVLVIIGLLLGGVLKGQELINSAKVKNMINDFRNVPVFIYGYQDKFKKLPGDDPAAATNVGATGHNGNGNGRLDGSWEDGQGGTAATTETYYFWEHVRRANLASGSTDTSNPASYLPTNSEGGFIGIESVAQPTGTQPYITNLNGTYLLCSKGILGKFAKQIDIQIDDGNTAQGQVRVVPNSGYTRGSSSGLPNTNVDDSTQYTVCLAF